MNWIFAIIFTVHLFFLSGYASRKLLFESFSNEKISILPNALESVTGYALTSLLCLGSLLAFGSLFYGGFVCCIYSYHAFYSYKGQFKFINFSKLTPAQIIKLAFVGVIFFIYLPCIFGLSTKYLFPSIYDLPKHIGAVISAAHANSWPLQNPYFPSLAFAYNVFFYLPLGLIADSFYSAKIFIPIFSMSILWVTWQTLGLLEMIMERFKFTSREQIVGLLLATFISNLIPLIFSVDTPYAMFLGSSGKASFWLDPPFISFIYLPQHLFCILTIMCAWIQWNSTISWRRCIVIPILLGCGILTSFPLAPYICAIFAIILCGDVFAILYPRLSLRFLMVSSSSPRMEENTRPTQLLKPALSVLLFLLITGYFIWQAKSWASNEEVIFNLSHHFFGFKWVLLSEAIIGLGCFISLIRFKTIFTSSLHLSYGLILLTILVCLPFVENVDFIMKTNLFLRFLLIPPAAFGLVLLWNKLKQFQRLRIVILGLPVIFFCGLSILVIGRFGSGSYIHRDYKETKILKKIQNLAFDKKIVIIEPNQEIAAISGHLVYMKFPYREGGYIPPKDRQKALNAFQGNLLNSLSADYVYINKILIDLSLAINESVVISLSELSKWQLSNQNSDIPLTYQMEKLSLNSGSHLVDAYYYTPLELPSGCYEIVIQVVGNVLEGSAHLSLMGEKKLITIPPGNYEKPKEFKTLVAFEKEGFKGRLAFGLGGWSFGSGEIQLKYLQIKELSFQSKK